MMPMPEDIKIQYEKDVEKYNLEIEKLKRKSISAKEILLNEQFDPFPNDGSQDDKIDFVNQFMPFILDLTLFPDEEVIQKLKEVQGDTKGLKKIYAGLKPKERKLLNLSNIILIYTLKQISGNQ